MLKHGEVNPLNVYGLRQLDHCPPHFEKVYFKCHTFDKTITDWIYENLEGRFWFGAPVQRPPKPESDSWQDITSLLASEKCAAFELHEEATVFLLMLGKINIFK